jgi:hypothetical protein
VAAEDAEDEGLVRFPADAYGHVRLRRERGRGGAAERWNAVISVLPLMTLDPEYLMARAQDFHVDDPQGPVGVVDEIRPGERKGEGEIVVACGWFGRHLLTLRFEDVEEIVPGEERLILRPGLSAVEEARRRGSLGGPQISTRIRDVLRRTILRGRRMTRGPAC